MEELVNEIYPSAEFNRTMPAENIGSPCLYLKMPLPSKMMIKQKTMEKIWKNQSRTDGGQQRADMKIGSMRDKQDTDITEDSMGKLRSKDIPDIMAEITKLLAD